MPANGDPAPLRWDDLRLLLAAARAVSLGFAPPLADVPSMRWLRRHGARDFSVRVTTVGALVAATRAGAGLALVPEHLAGDLERVLPRARTEPVAVHLVAHPDVRRRAHVRAFATELRSRFAARSGRAG